jgi:hypothetical protein
VRIILLLARAIERRGKFLHFILSDLRVRQGVVADIVAIVPFKTVPIGILAAADFVALAFQRTTRST